MKKSLIMLLCTISLFSLAACGSPKNASSEGTSSEEGITLQWVGAGWLANDRAEKCIAKWNELHPDIKVNYTELSTLIDEEYLKNLDIMISGGEQVDITYMDVENAYNRIMNGGALPISEYIEKAGDDYEKDFGALASTQLTYNDEIYGVPYTNNTYKVFYNKTLCDEKGITIPDEWSYEEFTEIAKQLNDPENNVYGCIFPSTWYDLCYAPAEVAGWKSVVTDADGNLVPNFEDPVFKENMQWIYDLAETYKVTPSYATINAESLNRRQALANGDAAMIIDGPYTLVWLNMYMFDDPGEGELPFELGVAELPYLTEEAKDVTFDTLVGTFYVPKTSAYPEWAYEFTKFVCTECCEESANYMPTYTEADMDTAIKNLTNYVDSEGVLHEGIYSDEIALKTVDVPHESHIAKWDRDPALTEYYTLMGVLFSEQYSLFLSGEMSLDDWCAMMQELGTNEIQNAQ